MKKIRCVIMRGGTSKAVVLHEKDLPADAVERKNTILKIFGSPDVRQIDGLGGADPLTSKCAVIGPSAIEGADVNYTFYQVGTDRPVVDEGMCGNISSVVGPFAIDEGLVKAIEPVTTVRIYNPRSKKTFCAEVPVKDGKAAVEGDFKIDGVPGTGAKIILDWTRVAGGKTGNLLTTGNTKDKIHIAGIGDLTVSIVYGASQIAFIYAEDIGLKGTEGPQEIDGDPDLLNRLETIRGTVGEYLKIISDWRKSRELSPVDPFIVFVNKPTDYLTYDGVKIKAEDIDFVARMMFMQQLHKTYAASGSLCTGIAAMIEGTIVNEVASKNIHKENKVRIGHPGGVIEVESVVRKVKNDYVVERSRTARTARRIMEGFVFIR
jgi:methylitaconate Delta-isomerase